MKHVDEGWPDRQDLPIMSSFYEQCVKNDEKCIVHTGVVLLNVRPHRTMNLHHEYLDPHLNSFLTSRNPNKQ